MKPAVTRRQVLYGAMMVAGHGAVTQGYAARRKFAVYDALLFLDKPDLTRYGIRKDWVVYTQHLWPSDTSDYQTPNEQGVRAAAQHVWGVGYRGLVQLDIEVWPVDIRFHAQAAVDEGIANTIQMWEWFKDEVPQFNVGVYYYPPISDVRGTNAAHVAWLAEANDYLAPLTAVVDAFYPQCYTLDSDQHSWVEHTRLKIAEARRLDYTKPVYPFIWPQYHQISGLVNTYVDYHYWLLQLHTIRNVGADGIILWGGHQVQWDDSQGWWRATKEFMRLV
jgi:Hyaluronidase